MGALEHTARACWRAFNLRPVGASSPQVPQADQSPIVCSSRAKLQAISTGAAPWHKPVVGHVTRFTADTLWLELDAGCMPLRRGRTLRLTLGCTAGIALTGLKARGRIARAMHSAHGAEVRLTLQRPSTKLRAGLAQYALSHGRAKGAALTPTELRHRHFGPMDASPCLRFGSLTDANEMAAVKQLRYEVFKQSALLKPSQTHPEDTADARDSTSHILTAYWHDQLVATCRIYAMEESDSYEFDAWAGGTDSLPPKADCVELGRAAIHPLFRNAGIPLQLFRMITAHTMASGRRYMVLGTQPSLVPFYRCFGFHVTPIRFPFPGRSDFMAHVLVADLHALWRGEDGNPLVWYALFGSLPKACAQGFYAPRSTPEKFRIEVLRRLGLVSRSVNHCLTWQSKWRQLMRT